MILRAYMMEDDLQSHIEQKGKESIVGLKDDIGTVATDFVENLVSVHKKYRWKKRLYLIEQIFYVVCFRKIILTVFQGNSDFTKVMDNALRTVTNGKTKESQTKSPELFAR